MEANQLSVEYVDLAPSHRALWMTRLVKLYAYVESIDIDNSQIANNIAHMHTGAITRHSSSSPISPVIEIKQ